MAYDSGGLAVRLPHSKEGTGAQLSYMRWSFGGRRKGDATNGASRLSGEAGDSKLWYNSDSHAPPPMTKAQVGVRMQPARWIEVKQQKGEPSRRHDNDLLL
jgi:hypothetical protein